MAEMMNKVCYFLLKLGGNFGILIMKTELLTDFIIYLAFHILPCVTSGNVYCSFAFNFQNLNTRQKSPLQLLRKQTLYCDRPEESLLIFGYFVHLYC